MKAAGIREAMFEVHGIWRSGLGFHPLKVARVIYRSGYDGPHAQVTDTTRLSAIRSTGLEAKLEKAAFAKSKYSRWPFESHFPSLLGVKCFAEVYLFDDEWITDHWRPGTPIIGSSDPSDAPLSSAARVGDLLGASNLLNSRQFSKSELDRALFEAVSFPSDNTDVIHLLISEGADPNAFREDGTSVLMESVDALNQSNIHLLVTSGADRAKKNRRGETAFSILGKRITMARPTLPPYVNQLANLLDPAQHGPNPD